MLGRDKAILDQLMTWILVTHLRREYDEEHEKETRENNFGGGMRLQEVDSEFSMKIMY